MRVYHDFFGTRIQINVSWWGSGSETLVLNLITPLAPFPIFLVEVLLSWLLNSMKVVVPTSKEQYFYQSIDELSKVKNTFSF